MMLTKVAVDKCEIDKLIRIKQYQKARNYIENVREVIEIVALNRVNEFVDKNIISKKNKKLFFSLIVTNINNKLLKDDGHILIDESYINSQIERDKKFKCIKEKRRMLIKKKSKVWSIILNISF